MRMTKTAVQNKGFPLAGLLSNVMVQDSAKYFAQFLTNPNGKSAESLADYLSKPDMQSAIAGGAEGFIGVTTRGADLKLSGLLISREGEFSNSIKKGSTADATPLIHTRSTKKCVGHSSVLRRCNSLRATSTSCRISSPALVPISSTRANASRADKRFDSALPSSWRRAISPCMAVTIKPAVDSPSRFRLSMSFNTSCGILAVTDCDFVFVGPVAIKQPSCNWCKTVYIKITYIKALTCKPPLTKNTYTLSTGKAQEVPKIAKPGSGGTLTGPLTTTDKHVSRQLCQIVPHPIWGGHHSARTNSPGVFSLSIATTKRPNLAVCQLKPKPSEKPAALLPHTSFCHWPRVCLCWRCAMRRTYDLPVNPTERTGQLISLTELMRAVFIGNAESRDEYMDALIGMLDMSLRDLHSMLEGHEIPGVSA